MMTVGNGIVSLASYRGILDITGARKVRLIFEWVAIRKQSML